MWVLSNTIFVLFNAQVCLNKSTSRVFSAQPVHKLTLLCQHLSILNSFFHFNTGVLERTRRRRVRSLGRTLIDKASLQNISVTLIRALWINEAENKIVVVRNVL